jgi:group I intron endonuclease
MGEKSLMHVYAIQNTANGKIYIGQTIQKLDRYLRSDITRALLKGEDRKPHLYNAIRKHGAENFVIRLLVNALDKEQADKLEQFFIRTLETQKRDIGYNIAAGGGGSFGYQKVFTPEHREKLAAIWRGRHHSEETKVKMRLASLGKPKSLEHREKLSKVRMGKKVGPFSDEHRRHMSEAATAAHARRKAACQNLPQ